MLTQYVCKYYDIIHINKHRSGNVIKNMYSPFSPTVTMSFVIIQQVRKCLCSFTHDTSARLLSQGCFRCLYMDLHSPECFDLLSLVRSHCALGSETLNAVGYPSVTGIQLSNPPLIMYHHSGEITPPLRRNNTKGRLSLR